MKSRFFTVVALAVSVCVEAASYSRTASLSGQSFLDAFSWQSMPDPTHGRVNYVDQATAQADGLYSVSGNTVTLSADDQTVLSASGPGRNSFRLMSNNQYTTHVAIFDIGHMPQGCGTWPAVCEVRYFLFMSERLITLSSDLAYRETGNNWPNEGEIDILEGVNDVTPNLSTLHTSPGCTMPFSRAMTGHGLYIVYHSPAHMYSSTTASTDCDVYANGNSGCGVRINDDNSYGPDFNNAGGGWYAIERSASSISIYFWERGDGAVPSEVQYPGNNVDTDTWGTPAAYFPDTDCDFSSHLGPMNIIINLTFCGDWAGAVYSQDGCPSTCVDYVNNNPGAFSGAYFEFNALNIYQ